MARLIFGIIVLLVTAGILIGNQEVLGSVEPSDKVKKLCEKHYESFKKFGTTHLEKNYPHLTFLKDCFVLYEDPNWNFIGKEKLDKYIEKKSKITPNNALLIKNYENQNLGITIMRTTSLGDGEYVLRVRLCIDDKTIVEPKFFVVTDKEYFLGIGNIMIKENSCMTSWTYAEAQDPEQITLFPFNGNYVPSKFMKIKSLN